MKQRLLDANGCIKLMPKQGGKSKREPRQSTDRDKRKKDEIEKCLHCKKKDCTGRCNERANEVKKENEEGGKNGTV